MNPHLAHELATLEQLTVAGLRARYAELFGEETRVGNKLWLIRRIAWRLQALAEGDLSQRARQRAAELARDTDVRLSPPRSGLVPALLPALRGQATGLRRAGPHRTGVGARCGSAGQFVK
jgi:hypothetical protein